MQTLSDLRPGQRAIVAGFRSGGSLVDRIMQLGVLEDSPVELIRRAPAGDPLEVRVLDYSLSLRRSEADLIEIRDIQ